MKGSSQPLRTVGNVEPRLKDKRDSITAHVSTFLLHLLGHQKGWMWVILTDSADTQDTTSRTKIV